MSLVIVINSSIEALELLHDVLRSRGFKVLRCRVLALKQEAHALVRFLQAYQPQAVLFDISIPYEENWQFFCQHVLPISGLYEQQFVLTTTNKAVLERLVGPTRAIELIGKPHDLEEIVTMVQQASMLVEA